MTQFLDTYRSDGFNKVYGFCSESALDVINHLEAINDSDKGIMEIGIHHGQFFIALNQLANGDSYAVDVFEDQHLNIDNSGEASRDIFLDNLVKFDYRYRGSNVKILQSDSLDSSITKQIDTQFKYISVDGGHTPHHVVNDLKLAEQLIDLKGVVVMDDYFNHWWPMVTEGICKYLETTPTLVPFASSHNKLWLCKVSYKKQYYEHSVNIQNKNITATNFFGYDIIDIW